MKFIFAILLSFIIVCHQTPVMQFLKFPVLVEHYKKHKKLDRDSIVEFLKEHYTAGHNDDDQSEDNKLPFKSGNLQDIGNAVVVNFANFDFSLNYDVPVNSLLRNLNIPQNHPFSIFHPPRV